MATDLEQLSVTLTAKISDFQAGMRQAGKEFDDTAGKIEDRNKQLTQSISSQMRQAGAGASFLSGVLKGLFSVYAIREFIGAVKEANQALADLGKKAQDTRIAAQEIAGLRLAGVQHGVSTAETDAALAHFTEQSKKTKEDAQGLYRALEQIGPQFSKAFSSAPTQAERLNVISRAFAATSDETKKAQLATNAFGTDNERLIATVQSSGGSLQTLAQRAKDAGIEIDDGLVKKAGEAQVKLDALAEVTASKLKVAFAELIPYLVTTLEEINSIVKGIEAAAGAAGKVGEVLAKLALLDKGGDRAQSNLVAIGPDGRISRPPPEPDAPLPLRRPAGTGGSGGAPAFEGRENLGRKDAAEKADEFDREEKRINKQINALAGQAAAVGKVGEAAAKAEASTRLWEAAQEAGLPKTAALTLQIDQLADRYAKVKARLDEAKLSQDLLFERQQLGRSADEQGVYSRLRGSHIDPDSDEGKRLADEMRTLRGLTEGKEMASSFVKGLISDLENGVKAGKALENQLKRIAEKLLDKTIDSAISGLFGAATGGGGLISAIFHSEGGLAEHGPSRMVPARAFAGARRFAEGGGIPAILHAGEIVLNQAQQKNVAAGMVGGGGKGITLTHAPVFNGTGLSKEEVVAVGLQLQKGFARQIGPILSDWQRRHG